MIEQQLLDALNVGEARDWEFKSARGGVPKSLWETYSAMANTDGGVIVLGVDEKNGRFTITGLQNPSQIQKNVWDILNDRGKVNINLLTDSMVNTAAFGDKTVLIMQVPRAARRERPVYIGQNPLTGTYRRNYEGDYHCSPEEVGRMLADREEEPADSRVLEHFTLNDLDDASLKQYRQLFASRAPDHPWLVLDTQELLSKLGGWRRDRLIDREGLTVAGLLMFGKDEVIRDPAAVPTVLCGLP
jgi:ATP-dependent DNA helicase RecG